MRNPSESVRDEDAGVTRPLDGILVVTLEQAVAAPFASSRLAEAGARVIKVERDVGDFARNYDHVVNGESAYFVWLNRGKESLVLNIKNEEDAALLARIVATADVFIQNLAPGAAARAGFDSAELRQKHPRLITCDISGYGEEGPYRDMKAYDMLVQAETGLCSITGTPESPGRVGVSVCDIAAGLYALNGILEALFERERTGLGKGLAVSLFGGMADWMTVPLLHFDYGGKAPGRVGLRHPSIAPYSMYVTADGEQVVISIQNEREWSWLCAEILGHPEWTESGPYRDNVSRVANRDSLEDEVGAVFARFTRDQMAEKLGKAGIAYGFVNSVGSLSDHPALRRCRVDTPSGPADMPAPPAIRSDGNPAPGPVPAIGQHSEMIRKEFQE